MNPEKILNYLKSNYFKIITLSCFAILFFVGLRIILKSDVVYLGSTFSMNLAGSILSSFSGVGFLLELYFNKR